MSTMNYYVVLGIAEDADEYTVRCAFRVLTAALPPGHRTVPPSLNSTELGKPTRRSAIQSVAVAMTDSCWLLVSGH